MGQIIDNTSAWQLRYDVLSVRAMLFCVGGITQEHLKPEVHLFLGDRYERLADHYAKRGLLTRARRFGKRASWHYEQGGFDDSPRAAALAMPVPRPRIFTDARSRFLGRGGSDDAA